MLVFVVGVLEFSYQVHLPSKVLVFGCLLTQDQEVVFLARNFRILIKDTFEVFGRYRVDDLLVFLSSHLRVQIQNRVVGLVRPYAVQTIIQTANVHETASNSKSATTQCLLAIHFILAKLFRLTKDCRRVPHLLPT